MNNVTKLLEGSVDEVKAIFAGLSHDDLLKLKAAEEAGKKRKGVVEPLNAAISEADARRAGGRVQSEGATGGTTHPPAIAADLDTSPAAEIAPATSIDTAGAPQQIVPDVDMSHPAVDADPRANTTERMNQIDFNDPAKPGHKVVEEALRG